MDDQKPNNQQNNNDDVNNNNTTKDKTPKNKKSIKEVVFVVCLLLLIIGGIVSNFVDLNSITKDAVMNPINVNDWEEQLYDALGSYDGSIEQDKNSPITGEYAVISAMNAIGEKRLSFLTDDKLTDNKKVELALKFGIIEKKYLKKNISQEKANEIIKKILDLYTDPEYYPEYFDVKTKTDIINADRWDISKYDEESQIITANINETPPAVGRIIMFTDEYGIAQAKYVTQVDNTGANSYNIQVAQVNNIADIFDELSFSGSSDFSYLVGVKTPGEDDKKLGEVQQTTKAWKNPFCISAYAAEFEYEWFEDKTALKKEKNTDDTKKSDIEFNLEITSTEKNGKKTSKVTSYYSVTSDGETIKYKYEIDNTGKEKLTTEVSGEGLPSFKFSEKDKKDENKTYFKDEKGVKANIKMEGFGICTSGYYQIADPDDSKNYVEILASADKVNISTSAKLSSEDKYKIGSIPIPIAATAGVISIDLNVYLVVGASGELTLWYEIDDPSVGMNVSIAKGVDLLHSCSNKDAGVRAKIEINGGFIGEAAVVVLKQWDLADPGVDVRAYASASTIDVKDTYKVKDEFLGTSCIELKAQAPVIKLTPSAGKDSLVYTILDTLKVEASYDLIKKDTDSKFLKKITYHVEHESDGEFTVTKLEPSQKHEDVCTHIVKKSEETILETDENAIDIGNIDTISIEVTIDPEAENEGPAKVVKKFIDSANEGNMRKFISCCNPGLQIASVFAGEIVKIVSKVSGDTDDYDMFNDPDAFGGEKMGAYIYKPIYIESTYHESPLHVFGYEASDDNSYREAYVPVLDYSSKENIVIKVKKYPIIGWKIVANKNGGMDAIEEYENYLASHDSKDSPN